MQALIQWAGFVKDPGFFFFFLHFKDRLIVFRFNLKIEHISMFSLSLNTETLRLTPLQSSLSAAFSHDSGLCPYSWNLAKTPLFLKNEKGIPFSVNPYQGSIKMESDLNYFVSPFVLKKGFSYGYSLVHHRPTSSLILMFMHIFVHTVLWSINNNMT